MFVRSTHSKLLATAGLLLLCPFSQAFAASYSQLVAFGDSLSDNGNAYLFTQGLSPGANYGNYTFAGGGLSTVVFSDGPNTTPKGVGPAGIWIDQLAGKLGVPDPLPFLAGGTNYAFGSAQSGTANPQDLGGQVFAFEQTHTGGFPANALYTFWAGANDILNGNDPVAAADNVEGYIAGLAAAGQKNFVWLNLPILGDTPDGQSQKDMLNAASLAFNKQWSADLAVLEGQGVHVTGVDMGSLFTKLVTDPGAYGLTNVTQAANLSTGTTDAGYLFWDGKHPTTAGHALVADAAFASLTATPEPGGMGLALLGLLALAGAASRRKASTV